MGVKALEGKPTKGLEVPLVHKDGSEEPIIADVTPKLNDAGDVVGAIVQEVRKAGTCTVEDGGDGKDGEHEANEHSSDLILPVGPVLLTNSDHTIELCTLAAETLLGYTSTE